VKQNKRVVLINDFQNFLEDKNIPSVIAELQKQAAIYATYGNKLWIEWDDRQILLVGSREETDEEERERIARLDETTKRELVVLAMLKAKYEPINAEDKV
jgi:Fe-S cluster biosynthesis and repair protein YggX